jgi:hypothetical protein
VGDSWHSALNMPNWIDFNGLYLGHPMQQQKYQSLTVFANALPGTQVRAYTLVNMDGPMRTEPLLTSDPNVNTNKIEIPSYPQGSPGGTAYLPVPQIAFNIDIPATGRMIRLRLDFNQTVDSNVTIEPVRVTHLGIQIEGERVDRS